MTTGKITNSHSRRAVSRAIGIDNKGIKEKTITQNLYKNKFKFKAL